MQPGAGAGPASPQPCMALPGGRSWHFGFLSGMDIRQLQDTSQGQNDPLEFRFWCSAVQCRVGAAPATSVLARHPCPLRAHSGISCKETAGHLQKPLEKNPGVWQAARGPRDRWVQGPPLTGLGSWRAAWPGDMQPGSPRHPCTHSGEHCRGQGRLLFLVKPVEQLCHWSVGQGRIRLCIDPGILSFL